MNDKKYYVKLKNTYKHDERLLSLNKVSGKIDFVDWRNSGAWWKGTKSELAEIMGGAIYKCHEATAEWNELENHDWNYNPYINTLTNMNGLTRLLSLCLWRTENDTRNSKSSY